MVRISEGWLTRRHAMSVTCNRPSNAVNFLAFGQVADDFGALFGTGFFKDRTTRYNDVAPATVHFQDLEWLLKVHQWACIAYRANVNLRAGQERNRAAKVNSEPTFNAAKDRAINTFFVSIGFFETIPSFFAAGHFT